MSLLSWVLVILIGTMVADSEGPKGSADSLPAETMAFDLYSEPGCSGSSRSYEFELTREEPQGLFRASEAGAPLAIKSLRVRRAEGGAVIGLFHEEQDRDPALSVSFAIDIHEPVCIRDLGKSSFFHNVHVVWSRAGTAPMPPMTFKKVTVSRPPPHFFVLGSNR